MCVSVCKCDECSFFNYCINMDFESVNKNLYKKKIKKNNYIMLCVVYFYFMKINNLRLR